jgi:type IV pilus assembly protein PilM
VQNPFQLLLPRTGVRPGLACEITPEGVVAARQVDGTQAALSFAPLEDGAIIPGTAAPNFADPALITSAVRKALDEVAAREKQITLVVPDAAVRILIMDFDALPSKPQDALPIVRFRLRKLMPFEVEDAAVSYQVMRRQSGQAQPVQLQPGPVQAAQVQPGQVQPGHAQPGPIQASQIQAGQVPAGQVRVLVTVMPALRRAEYESAVRAAGYQPGVLLPSTLAALAALPSTDPVLLVSRNGLSLTTAIATGSELLLYRTLELPPEDELSPFASREELSQTVFVALSYFEDVLHAQPELIYYAGPGGAIGLQRDLADFSGEPLPPISDLAAQSTGAVTAMPKGLIAGVMGALAS